MTAMAKFSCPLSCDPLWMTEFLAIIQSGKAAPGTPKFLHRALARGAVSLLPPLVRTRLALGRAYDPTLADKIALKAAGALADRHFDPASPPCQASVRLGLPANFLYRGPSRQTRWLRQAGILAGGQADDPDAAYVQAANG